MPNYEFQCEDCQKNFSLQLTLAEHEAKDYQCPKCKSKNVKQLISTFQAQTSSKS